MNRYTTSTAATTSISRWLLTASTASTTTNYNNFTSFIEGSWCDESTRS
jgi:hypothetical protein